MVARTSIVFWGPPIGILILFIVLYIPEFFGESLWITYTERMNLILTVALIMFAAIEGYSTNIQAELQKRRNLIDDARNELEKAYGPLYTLLNEYPFLDTIEHEFGKPQNLINLDAMKKMRLDNIVATHPLHVSFRHP